METGCHYCVKLLNKNDFTHGKYNIYKKAKLSFLVDIPENTLNILCSENLEQTNIIRQSHTDITTKVCSGPPLLFIWSSGHVCFTHFGSALQEGRIQDCSVLLAVMF